MKKFTLIRSEVVPMLITETVEIEANDLKEAIEDVVEGYGEVISSDQEEVAHAYNIEKYDDAVVTSVDIYLSGGQIVTLDLADDPIDSENLMSTLGFDENYWNTIYGKDINPTNLCKSNLKSEVKSTYNPYE